MRRTNGPVSQLDWDIRVLSYVNHCYDSLIAANRVTKSMTPQQLLSLMGEKFCIQYFLNTLAKDLQCLPVKDYLARS
ncbi:MAG: hypothetical protein MESAZ_02205 [Saezia sanguinis]